MTSQDVTVKKEHSEEEIQPASWQDNNKDSTNKKMNDQTDEVPAEICVVIGDNRKQQSVGENSPERHEAAMSQETSWSGSGRQRSIPPRISTSSPGSYECGICRKKYKYYNCFQTHVRAHIDNESASGEGASQGKTGNYTCEYCGKQYKYYTPYQEHVALHAPIKRAFSPDVESRESKTVNNYDETNSNSQHSSALYIYISAASSRTHPGMADMVAGGNVTSWQKESSNPLIGSPFPLVQDSRKPYLSPTKTSPCMNSGRGSAPKQEIEPRGGELEIGKGWKKKIKRKEETNHKPVREEKGAKIEVALDTSAMREESGSQMVQTSSRDTAPSTLEPYTCGACGIQFQFYNNLLEHMQSHAADNENNIPTNQSRTAPPTEEHWKTQPQRNNTNNTAGTAPINNSLPEKERQHIAERLLRVMCADLGALSVVNSKDFLKLAQTLVDTGARYGSFSVNEILGNMNTLALKHLPRMYNQVKVKVTCALGSNACLGIGVTCHSQSVGSDSCYILTAYQVECKQIKRYVLGIKDVDNRDSGEFIHQWVQNVLSEFVMSDIRTVYVTDCKVNSSAFSKAGTCLRCSACSLNSVVQSVLNKRTLQARSMHEVIELLTVTEELAGSSGIAKETFGSLEESCPPPCWNSVTDSLLLVHERYEQICEFYSRAKKMNIIQNLNKHLLSNLAAILAPVKQAVINLSNERKPTLQLVLPTYVKLEKLFTSKANDAGIISKLCHLFLEALKENFKVESAHKVAMILDPQQKLRPVPPYQHEEIIGKVCELINEVRDVVEEQEFETPPKKLRQTSETSKGLEEDCLGKGEVYDYLQEPLFQVTPDLFHYWSSVTQKHSKLAKLAFWLLAVPAVGARSECVNMCEQTLLIKRRRLLSTEETNKVMFLKSNML
ncbi:zinc finger protein 618 isoform X10 [Xenopus laevis]|uniref:Zinc finger protein 618 isoform X10 n=1 Tax=Xenopus laevis TaxID=8355 RepID=A0A8J1LFL2_XENLA|nr:zinc finger protein 618 isoform X10 [Xenopus laevis]